MTLHVVIVQRILADFRLPLLEELRKSQQLEVSVVHSNVAVDGARPALFETSRISRLRTGRILQSLQDAPTILANMRPKPDCIVVEGNPRMVVTIHRILRYARRHQIPVLLWGAGQIPGDGSRVRRLGSDLAVRSLLRQCSGAIGYNETATDFYSARLASDRKGQAWTAPNSTVSKFESAPRSGHQGRIIYIGKDSPAKRLEVVPAAVRLLEDCEWSLTVHAPTQALRRVFADVPDYGGRLTLAPPLNGEGVQAALRSADFLLMPGSGGLILQEAMASAVVPCIGPIGASGDGSLTSELLAADGAVFAIDSSAAALGAALRTCLTWSSDEYRRRSGVCLRIAQESTGLDRMARAIGAAVRQVVEDAK